MLWRYAIHEVVGNLAAAVQFLNTQHPDWDVVGIQFLPSRNPDVTAIIYRQFAGIAPAPDNPAPPGDAPPEFFANGLSPGPAPTPSLSSPMAVLKRTWPDLDEAQIDAKVQHMSKAEYEALPPHVREKMSERTAYFQTVDSNFQRPPWYEGNAVHPFYPPKKPS